jgi:hypothetical protein
MVRCFLTEAKLCQGRITIFQLRAPESKPLCKEQADELAIGGRCSPLRREEWFTGDHQCGK